MGLTIVHGIVLGLSGAVRVTSTPGQGTSFAVYLPIHLPTEAVAGSAVPVGCMQQLQPLMKKTAERSHPGPGRHDELPRDIFTPVGK
jgi:hypothetical protein